MKRSNEQLAADIIRHIHACEKLGNTPILSHVKTHFGEPKREQTAAVIRALETAGVVEIFCEYFVHVRLLKRAA